MCHMYVNVLLCMCIVHVLKRQIYIQPYFGKEFVCSYQHCASLKHETLCHRSDSRANYDDDKDESHSCGILCIFHCVAFTTGWQWQLKQCQWQWQWEGTKKRRKNSEGPWLWGHSVRLNLKRIIPSSCCWLWRINPQYRTPLSFKMIKRQWQTEWWKLARGPWLYIQTELETDQVMPIYDNIWQCLTMHDNVWQDDSD